MFLQKYELDKWSNSKESSVEKILIFYLVTDYICCGLSSPEFHIVFHKYLNTEHSKIKLLKDLVNIWASLFKHFKIPSMLIKYKCIKQFNKQNYNNIYVFIFRY